MNRRVIFPDIRSWTRKEPITMTADPLTPRDYRLAAVLIKHHRLRNSTGVTEIVREAADTDRATPLLAAVLDIHITWVTRTRNDVGLDYYAELIHSLGDYEPADQEAADQRNAVAIIEGYARSDYNAINATMDEIHANHRGTHTFLSILDCLAHSTPELTAPGGIRWLNLNIDGILGQEAGDQ